MKKTINVLTICLLLFAASQTAQAQTKEATIAWIKDKLQRHVPDIDHNAGVEFNDKGYISFKTRPYIGDEYYIEYHLWICDGKWSIGGDGVRATTSAVHTNNVTNETYTSYVNDFPLRNGEENIRERMAKALNHLAAFCEQKEEVF